MKRANLYNTVISLFSIYLKKKRRESYPLIKIGIFFFAGIIALNTIILIIYFGKSVEAKSYLLAAFSKLYLFYLAAGFTFRMLLQPLPHYDLKAFKVLNIPKLNIAVTLCLIGLFNTNNYISLTISGFITWIMYSILGGSDALSFVILSVLWIIIANTLVGSIKVATPAILHYCLITLLTYGCVVYFRTLLGSSEYVFYELIEKPKYIFLLLIASLILLTGYVKLIKWHLYSE